MFLIFINDSSGDLSSKAKLFPDDTSLFNVVHDIDTSSKELNSDPSKQTQEVIFSRKLKNVPHPPLVFENVNVSQCKSQKHQGIILDTNLAFEKHYKKVLSKTNKTTGLLRKFFCSFLQCPVYTNESCTLLNSLGNWS